MATPQLRDEISGSLLLILNSERKRLKNFFIRAQVVEEHLPSNCEALSSNSSTSRGKKNYQIVIQS
jgi:hypothetical protein